MRSANWLILCLKKEKEKEKGQEIPYLIWFLEKTAQGSLYSIQK